MAKTILSPFLGFVRFGIFFGSHASFLQFFDAQDSGVPTCCSARGEAPGGGFMISTEIYGNHMVIITIIMIILITIIIYNI